MSLRCNRPICTPVLLLGAKTRSCVELLVFFTESNVPSFFEHNMIFFYVIPLRYAFKLISFRPKGRPKMRQFFEFLQILNKKLIFCQCSSQ